MSRKKVSPTPTETLQGATRTAAPARTQAGPYGDLVGGIADLPWSAYLRLLSVKNEEARPSGSFDATPEEAFDCSASVYLQD